jgi:hypothetical protein
VLKLIVMWIICLSSAGMQGIDTRMPRSTPDHASEYNRPCLGVQQTIFSRQGRLAVPVCLALNNVLVIVIVIVDTEINWFSCSMLYFQCLALVTRCCSGSMALMFCAGSANITSLRPLHLLVAILLSQSGRVRSRPKPDCGAMFNLGGVTSLCCLWGL